MSVEHLCEPKKELAIFERLLKPLITNGSTNLTDAILMATRDLLDKSAFRVICIATDGLPDNPYTALEAANHAKKKNRIDSNL